MKKFEFTGEVKLCFGITLRQIRAVVSFGSVAVGEVGGWIEKEENLDTFGNAWVYGDARVFGNALVSGDARVYGDARVLWITKIGSRLGTTTFCVDSKIGISVSCGCFFGSIDDFAAAVSKTHGDNEHGKAYRLAIKLAKNQLSKFTQ